MFNLSCKIKQCNTFIKRMQKFKLLKGRLQFFLTGASAFFIES